MGRWRVIAYTTLVVAACALVQVAVNLIGRVTSDTFGIESAQGNTRVSLVLIIIAFAASFLAFATLVAVGIADGVRDALYWPLASLFGALALYLGQTSATALDFLLHGLKPHWQFLYDPDVRLWQNALLLIVGASLMWVGGLFLYSRWRNPRRLAIFYLVYLAMIAAIAIILVAFDHYW
jgi:hypothetical protein